MLISIHFRSCRTTMLTVIVTSLAILLGGQAKVKAAHRATAFPELSIDTGYLTINTTNVEYEVEVLAQSTDCYKCPLQVVARVDPSGGETVVVILVNTTHTTELAVTVLNDSVTYIHREVRKFGERGEYVLTVKQLTVEKFTVDLETRKEPIASNLPILIAFAIFFLLAALWIVGKKTRVANKLTGKWESRENNEKKEESSFAREDNNTEEGESTPTRTESTNLSINDQVHDNIDTEEGNPTKTGTNEVHDEVEESSKGLVHGKLDEESIVIRHKRRLRSLDAFRGLSMVFMIFVNYGGGRYWFFDHARWNGLYPASLLFPWFMWIMGLSLMFSLQSQVNRQCKKRQVIWKIVFRSMKLIFVGIILNSVFFGYDLAKLRIPGVLQRFGLCYLIVGLVAYAFYKTPDDDRWSKRWSVVKDILPYWIEWLVMLLMMAVFLCVTFLLDVPGCGKGYLGPGGISENGTYHNCTGGAAGYIDRQVFGEDHLYQYNTAMWLYQLEIPFDPEGILGTLTSSFLVFLGFQAGKILVCFPTHSGRMLRFVIWGVISGCVALALCGASLNDGWMPINKNMWSLSFVLALAATAFVCFAFCYYIIDVVCWWNGSPFYQLGMNPIAVYIGAQTFYFVFPWRWEPFSVGHAEILAMNIWATTIWALFGHYLHMKKVYIVI